ncbi:MAG: phytoene desaturase family protein, partial [Thermohalobaculum sp.]|nr:phytoene desaturase family protein [Thermohalobaculum sp.]
MAKRSENGHVVIVGAGIGGLAAGLALVARGVPVTICEAGPAPGGKIRAIAVAGRAVDAGPTVMTMRWVFDDLLAEAGASLDAEVAMEGAAILARHAWTDGSRLDLHADPEASAAAVAAFAGHAEADRFRGFQRATARAYGVFRDSFIAAERPGPLSVVGRVGLAGLPALVAARPMMNMWRTLGGHFRDPRLRQLFGRYATYCGSSPFLAPATLMLIAHVEQAGVWRLPGGMHGLAAALARLVEARGGRVMTGAPVARILTSGGRAAGVRLVTGEAIAADAVIFNGDAAALAAGLLGPEAARAVAPIPPAARSLSAVVWSAVARPAGLALSHHTVLFGDDYRAEFDQMFRARRLATQPTIYICAQDRDAAGGPAPTGPERLHIQINAPADGDRTRLTTEEIEACQQTTRTLMDRCGLSLALDPAATVVTTPADFARAFPATGGALYGAATHGALASFRRPGAVTGLPGLYLAGGSAHPGAGVP